MEKLVQPSMTGNKTDSVDHIVWRDRVEEGGHATIPTSEVKTPV